jgi:uncharacterized membrane protein YjdF
MTTIETDESKLVHKHRSEEFVKVQNRRKKADHYITIFVFLSLVLSAIYSIIMSILAPSETIVVEPYDRHKSDYILMLLQSLLGLVIMGLPSLLKRRWKLELNNLMRILFVVFLYCAIVLGEVQNFYYKVPHWDTVLHTFSGAMLGAMGFTIVSALNDNTNIRIQLADPFAAVFSFCFALSLGAVWEIYEFTMDTLLSLNMQKYAMEDGTQLLGALALQDTMKDLVVDALGALLICLVGFISARRKHLRELSQPTAMEVSE